MPNCFYEIRKWEITDELKLKGIRHKYRNDICDNVKTLLNDYLPDAIEKAIEQQRQIEGIETLSKYTDQSIVKCKGCGRTREIGCACQPEIREQWNVGGE